METSKDVIEQNLELVKKIQNDILEVNAWRSKANESISELEVYQKTILNNQEKVLISNLKSETFVDDVNELKSGG